MFNGNIFLIIILCFAISGCQKKEPRVKKYRPAQKEMLSQQTTTPQITKKIILPRSVSYKRQLVDKIVARVNGNNILLSNLVLPRIDTGTPYVKQHYIDSGNEDLYKLGLELAIAHELLFQKAADRKLLPSTLDVDKQIASLKVLNKISNLSDEEFEKELEKEGFTYATYRLQLSKMLAIEKLRQTELNERTVVTTKEVKNYYQNHKEQIPEKYTLKKAVFNEKDVGPFPTKQDLLTKKEIVWEELPILERSEIGTHISSVFTMKEGDISQPIKIPFGYQLIMLAGNQEKRFKTIEEQYSKIEHLLRSQKLARFEEKFIKELRADATIVYL